MTGQQDNPDDLIAELTKLMALESRPAGERDKPAPIPSAPAVAAIPQRPAVTPARGPAAQQPVQPGTEQPRNWPRPATSHPAAANDGRPEQVPSPSAPAAGPADGDGAEAVPSFEFDFGFNRQRPEALPRGSVPVSPARPPAQSVPAPVVKPAEHDPIAELIAAELRGIALPTATSAPEPALPAKTEPQLAAAPPVVKSPVTAEAPRPAPQANPQASPSVAPQVAPAARVPAEGDRFATAPVFGLGNRPVAEAPAAKPALDPIDEIENLIGEAVRVELGNPPAAPVRQAEPLPVAPPATRPVVPPLGGFTPRRTQSLRDAELADDGADEAIRAATADAAPEPGVDSPHIDSAYEDERPAPRTRGAARQHYDRHDEEERAKGGAFRQFVVPIMAGVVLVAIGFGLYWALGMGHHEGAAPVLTADATPAKTIPPKPADTTPHSVVMDELSGNPAKPAAETLVSRDQTRAPDGTTQVAAVSSPTPAPDDASLANRKVRTVTVRPDGTIISGDDSVAGGTALPVDRPNVPAVPGVAVANASEPAALPAVVPAATRPAAVPSIDTSGVPSDDPIAQAIAASAPDIAGGSGPANAAAAPADQVASADPATSSADAPPVPMPRTMRPEVTVADTGDAAAAPKPAPTSPVNAVVQDDTPAKPMKLLGDTPAAKPGRRAEVTHTTGASTGASPVVDASAVPGTAHVQLASQPSEAAAQSTASALEKRFGNLFNGAKLTVVRADLGGKGVYYRVEMPTSSLGDAQQLCASIKSNGGDCVAANG
ncbi:MAG TPA: SPOR domain-containing protein [Devosia sp.]|nr:SPOR domain-containing protein [Devosia sp.]